MYKKIRKFIDRTNTILIYIFSEIFEHLLVNLCLICSKDNSLSTSLFLGSYPTPCDFPDNNLVIIKYVFNCHLDYKFPTYQIRLRLAINALLRVINNSILKEWKIVGLDLQLTTM